MGWFGAWRRARILKRSGIDEAVWRRTVSRHAFTGVLAEAERARLRELAALFLHEKSIYGAGGFVANEDVRASIATQACILILNLGLDYYRGWLDIIVYPGRFVAPHAYADHCGVVHEVREPATGESWLRGPVILSWEDVEDPGSGYNVVIHEFAHKIDMLNGDANGYPPLHADMNRGAWSRVFSAAYEDLCRRVESGEATLIDPYAAEDPGEFFAVMSEAFFETPLALRASHSQVYRQLALFYRQDPALRLAPGVRADDAIRPGRVNATGRH